MFQLLSCKPGFYEEVHGPDFQGFQHLEEDPAVIPVHHELVHHLPLSHHQPLQRKDSSPATPHHHPLPHQQSHDFPEKKQEFVILSPVLNHVYNTGVYAPEPDNFLYHGGGDFTKHEHEQEQNSPAAGEVKIVVPESTAPKLVTDSTDQPLPHTGSLIQHVPTFQYHRGFFINNRSPTFNNFHLSVPAFKL